MKSCIVILKTHAQPPIIGIAKSSCRRSCKMDRNDREVTVMMWILLASLVGVVALSVKDQLNRERDAQLINVLAREYSL